MPTDEHQIAERIADGLARREQRLVLAESCTGGLVAASLARVPGISAHFCGSAVVYRESAKQDWLGIPSGLIERHTAVSPEVTRAIGRAALERTAEASISLAITGHLGPDAPPEADGIIYVAVHIRRDSGTISLADQASSQLLAKSRTDRQREAARTALTFLGDHLADPQPSGA